jgi:hypothetical protein
MRDDLVMLQQQIHRVSGICSCQISTTQGEKANEHLDPTARLLRTRLMSRRRLHEDPLPERNVALAIKGDPFEMPFDALTVGRLGVLSSPPFLGEIADRLKAEGWRRSKEKDVTHATTRESEKEELTRRGLKAVDSYRRTCRRQQKLKGQFLAIIVRKGKVKRMD